MGDLTMNDSSGPAVENESGQAIDGCYCQAYDSKARDLFASEVRKGLRDKIKGHNNLQRIKDT
jgi:hypothetical protein